MDRGRRPALDADGRKLVRQLYHAREFTMRELACVFHVSRSSILRYVQEGEA